MINIMEFGAVGDGVTLNTESIQAAVDRASETREAVMIPCGVFITGTVNLKGASLYLESGAVLKGSENLDDYPEQDYIHNELGALRAMLIIRDCDHVTIEGSGTIDFSGRAFYDTSARNVPDSRVPFNDEQISECTYPIGQRPNECLFFHNSQNIVVRGIKIIDAPCWTISFHECENIKVIGLTIDTDLNMPNNDGMHFCSCKGVIVSDCNISSGDDCIAISGITNWEKPCENIVITNCILRSCSKAIVIGYIYSCVRNVAISNCIIKESNRGLCIMCNDESSLVENVRVTNMIIDTVIRAGNWWGNGEPIFMMAVKHDYHIAANQHPEYKTDCAIRNVCIDGVSCTGENAIGIIGQNGNIREVELKNINYVRKPSKNLSLKGETFDFSPGRVDVDIPRSCGIYVSRDADAELKQINTHEWSVITDQSPFSGIS
ncbi:glycoside hydrolase [Hungatella sp. L12]|uniref:Glycoside hydrolase n=1 Tax=Hungatella hominis TaxID=2763050 RepID=A0ABR7H873_9FIRM|nr:glycosyl hydrolase family 28 protein [Hungatella hominis]MBC5709382.1 glycoside hydrolase [Hungatella hominis]